MTQKEQALQRTMDSALKSQTQEETPKASELAQAIRDGFSDPRAMESLVEMMGTKSAAQMFVQTVVSAVTKPDSAIKMCSKTSIIHSAMVAAYTGLTIEGSLGQAALVPYKGTAVFVPMRNGLVMLAMQTGMVAALNDSAVREGDIVKNDPFTGEFELAQHNFTSSEEIAEWKARPLIGWVAYLRLINGFEKYLFMTVEELEAWGRRYSASYRNGKGLWASKDPTQKQAMYAKTVLKQVLKKYCPLRTAVPEELRLAMALKLDGAAPKKPEIHELKPEDIFYPDGTDINEIEEAEILEHTQEVQDEYLKTTGQHETGN